jgi:predicted CXXCH cytochrome family protein
MNHASFTSIHNGLRSRAVAACIGTVALMASLAAAQPSGVVFSRHNLSASGPGTVKAVSEDQVCIFCHTPHNASPVQPLWNRAMSISSYLPYSSRALDAAPGQPTGTSKMCLSCHDGTIALGALVTEPTPVVMTGGVTRMPAGHANIGTDLRDDHPISFRFDSSLASRDRKLRSPTGLPSALKLDSNAELQCTTCHDAHNNAFGKFLTMQNSASQLCISCHNMGTTTVTGHNACNACHQPHSAPSGPYLLRGQTITTTCLQCHNGSVATAPNILTATNRAYNHDTASMVDPPDPQQSHTTCVSCHDPHTMGTGRGVAPAIHPNFGRIAGVNIAGTAVEAATYEYETCLKCHADAATILPRISRRVVSNNTRLEFSPTAVSFHPVAAAGRNSNVPSLKPPLTASSLMYCSDCHAADGARSVGGSGPNGTHGSSNAGLLVERYDTADNSSESAAAYALCYRCHDRSNLMSESASSFRYHKKHVQEERTPCIACHDSHGISSTQGNATNNSHLINFATNIVTPNSQGRLEFIDTGTFRGTCNLRCHGDNHVNKSY